MRGSVEQDRISSTILPLAQPGAAIQYRLITASKMQDSQGEVSTRQRINQRTDQNCVRFSHQRDKVSNASN